LATLDNTLVGLNTEENEYNLVDTLQSELSADPWSAVLG